ncbi:hypothetical protein CAPTEDRAFT_178735 [Capitella teleta]|uniref:B30.2/SPRY domain-containing protein n=1 Tax=Capitella teleta TaxID=283909 RepID=R7TI32_CAPTE|nr:hypothetical protein CAPTEDRAFT_178735 [Capitella teleta]|eukprot:ELT91206.1 hypothetical protein CAPTEDRAFT_178735 [Capitella teleta]
MNDIIRRRVLVTQQVLAGERPCCHPAVAFYVSQHILVSDDTLRFSEQRAPQVAVFVSKWSLTPSHSYYEVELTDTGKKSRISLGLGHTGYALDCKPGIMAGSVAYHLNDGRLFEGSMKGVPFGPKGKTGDRIGCGVRFDQRKTDAGGRVVPVFFTVNGREIGSVLVPLKLENFHPLLGMASEGETVTFMEHTDWKDVTHMAVDSYEEDWGRLHDVQLTGQTLEYVGRGKSIMDIGLAQAKQPLNTRSHYFEIQISDPGDNCYIAIGLTCRNYPKHRHPGWDRGSIAYHADDGKIFVGRGIGEVFGPKCHKGDVMGCGILFPRDFRFNVDSPSDDELSDREEIDFIEDFNPEVGNFYDEALEEEEEEEEEGAVKVHVPAGVKVQVFFTRNGTIVGRRDIGLPKGGFYPTIGMLSSFEKVIVDLHPMTG